MKSRRPFQENGCGGAGQLCWALCLAASTLAAADTNAPQPHRCEAAPDTNAPSRRRLPAPLTPEQMFEGGTKPTTTGSNFGGRVHHQRQQSPVPAAASALRGCAFGGIEDFHYAGDLAKGTTLTVDGRALFR